MEQNMSSRKIFKAILIGLVALLFSNILLPSIKTYAAEKNDIQKLEQIDQEEFRTVLNQIIEYSEYDYDNQKWILSYDIVTDGIFTKEQYVNAEKSGEEWMKVETLANESKQGETTRALPVLLVLAIKAVGVSAGTAAVTEITTAFTKWGLSASCNKYKKYASIKSFCKVNGYA